MGNPKRASSASASASREVDIQLHNAARSGDLQTVQSILNSNPLAVNSRDKHSRTPLHLAAWSGQTEVVNYLCKNKADVGAAAMDDMGAIHFAAQKGHLEVVRTLLSNGVSVKASTRKGMTPLHYAAQGSYLDLVKYLVRKGSNLNVRTKTGKTPLDLSTSEVVRLFLEEAEKLPKQEDTDVKEKESVVAEKTEKDESRTDAVTHDAEEEKDDDEKGKRKGDIEDIEAPSKPKKPRVALNHLLTMDDNQEDEDDIV